jgi:hypothetical protein
MNWPLAHRVFRVGETLLSWHAQHRLLPARKARRRVVVLFLAVVLLTPIGLIPRAQTASAQISDCDVAACPPPALLNLNQSTRRPPHR